MSVPDHLRNQASTAQIFLIDDEPLVIETFIATLRDAGFHNLHGFSEVGDAVKMLRCLRPDLILTDIHMPGTSGSELVGLVRNFEHLEAIPIVAVTADRTSKSDLVPGLGVDAVLLKPVAQHDLIEMVSRYVLSSPAVVQQ